MAGTAPEKNIVMIVHGIGEQRPGETIDRFVGAATDWLGLQGRVSGHTELLVERSRDSAAAAAPDGQMRLFPCPIRRVTIPAGTGADRHRRPEAEQEIIAAEVYWADLSAASRGIPAVLQDMLHTVLALGYLALDNVRYAGTRSGVASALVSLYVLIFHGLIAPANALMLAGALVMILTDLSMAGPRLPLGAGLAIAGVLWTLSLGVALARRRAAREAECSRLASDFWQGILAHSAAMLAITLAAAGWQAAHGGTGNDLFEFIARFLVMMMVVAWGMALCVLSLMVVHAIARALRGAWVNRSGIFRPGGRRRRLWRDITAWQRQRQTIYIPICCAMLILWTVFSASFWSAFSWSAAELPALSGSEGLFRDSYDSNVERATKTLFLLLIGAGIIAALGACVGMARHRWRSFYVDDESPMTVWLGRAILNPVIGLLLFGLVFWIGYASILALVGFIRPDPSCPPDALPALAFAVLPGDILPGAACEGMGSKALTFATLLGLLMFAFHESVGNGLGVIRDVASYSIQTRPAGSSAPIYPVRRQMETRFDVVLDYLSALMPDATRLIVISHSQGTMIAALSLQNLPPDTPPKEWHLVTMGSPLGHIYQQYFPNAFRLGTLPARLTSWRNIYRRDDFVGTSIRGDARIENLPVDPGGHLKYWTDERVWDQAPGWLGRRGGG